MGQGRIILDGGDLHSACLQGGDGGFATRSRAIDPHFQFQHTELFRL